MNKAVLANSGRDIIRVPICLRIVGKALIVRNGRITLNARRALKLMSTDHNSMKLYEWVIIYYEKYI